MIIHNFDVADIITFPLETNPPLIIDPDAVLPGPIPAEFFQPVGRRDPQVVDDISIIEHTQLAQGYLLDVGRQLFRALAVKDLLRFLVFESLYHNLII